MKFELKEALFLVGLGLSVVSTAILYLGYKLIASATLGVIVGVALLVYYLILGSLGGILLLVGKSPTTKLNYVLPAVAAVQFVLAYLTITAPVKFSPTNLILFIPPTLVAVRTGMWVSKKGTVKMERAFRFFKRIS